MPLNARRRRPKIVNQSLDRQRELAGGIKNALERGSSLAQAKQSFLNAGYKPEEINTAVNSMASIRQTAQPLPTTTPQIPTQSVPQIPGQPQQPTPQIPGQPMQVAPTIPGQPAPKKPLSKTFIVVSIILTVVILGAAALLGIFWNSLF